MLMVLSSPDAVAPNNRPQEDLVRVLINAKAQGHPVGLISNHGEPDWFEDHFEDTGVQFIRDIGRQNGKIIPQNAEKLSLHPYDALVLAVKPEDIQMGKNGGAVLVAAGWSNDRQVQGLGIRANSAEEFEMVLGLSAAWEGHWWFNADDLDYGIRALADLSGYGKGITQQIFARKVTGTVKQGGGSLNALLVVTARSLLIDGVGDQSNLMWGVYPSSSSTNDDSEVLSDFTHRLRTTVSRVRLARKDAPLFIRHTHSVKRSSGQGLDRIDPSNQIETIHLNPAYRKNVGGRNVIVLDDCTTYGTSFGVAAAFLRKAGAASCTGVALGKFGNQSHYYDIDINSDPFRPVGPRGYKVNNVCRLAGDKSGVTQAALRELIP